MGRVEAIQVRGIDSLVSYMEPEWHRHAEKGLLKFCPMETSIYQSGESQAHLSGMDGRIVERPQPKSHRLNLLPW